MAVRDQLRRFAALLVMAVIASSLVLVLPVGRASAAEYIGVSYGPPVGNGHLLDIYLPDTGTPPYPVLIWNQGSAWTSDNGRAGAPVSHFVAAGYAVVGMSIRSSGQATFPAQLCDIKGAIRFLRMNARLYGLDSDRFAIMGFSSGGWTAAIAGTTGDTPDPVCDFALPDGELWSDRVQAAIPLHPPTDFLQMNAACLPSPDAPMRWAENQYDSPPCAGAIDHDSSGSPESSLIGCAIQTCPEEVRLANPITYVSSDDPPFLLMHGREDSLVPHNQSALLKNALIEQCLDVTMYSLPGHNHATLYLDNGALSEGRLVVESENCATSPILTELDTPPATYDTIIDWLCPVLELRGCADPTPTPTPTPAQDAKTTGGGFLIATDGSKINFGFNAERKSDGTVLGQLQLNDKRGGVKIHITTVTSLTGVTQACGDVPAGPGSLQFTGTGNFGKENAAFFVCVADFGEPSTDGPGERPDLLYLECTTGCAYATGDQAIDDQVDGGNIQVQDAAAGGSSGASGAETGNSAGASTMILDPVLHTEGRIGYNQQLTVIPYGTDLAPLISAEIELSVFDHTGALLQTLTGLSNTGGQVTFNVPILPGEIEYIATSGSLSSNAISVTGVTGASPGLTTGLP
jgi:acetyl esterase/lipase